MLQPMDNMGDEAMGDGNLAAAEDGEARRTFFNVLNPYTASCLLPGFPGQCPGSSSWLFCGVPWRSALACLVGGCGGGGTSDPG